MKKNKKLLIISIIVFIILFGLLVILSNIGNSKEEQTVDNWYKTANSGSQVVTIIGSSTCSHCQEYKPVITSLAKKYKFKLFFFEVDTLTKEETNTLYNTYDLKDFDGHVPYTFIINDNDVISTTVGFSSRENTIEFLKESKVIKN